MLLQKNQNRKYYLGEGTDHVIVLTEDEAFAVNNIRFEHVKDDIYSVNLTHAQMQDYDSAASKINRYMVKSPTPVYASDEFLKNNDQLRPV